LNIVEQKVKKMTKPEQNSSVGETLD